MVAASTTMHSRLRAASGKPRHSGIEISNRDRVIFPEGKLTKGSLADNYETVAPIMLPGRKPADQPQRPGTPAARSSPG